MRKMKEEKISVNRNISLLPQLCHHHHPLFFSLPLNKVNDNGYLQEVQQGQKDLEDLLHHGGLRDQQDQGCQQVQFHPKRENDTGTLASKYETI